MKFPTHPKRYDSAITTTKWGLNGDGANSFVRFPPATKFAIRLTLLLLFESPGITKNSASELFNAKSDIFLVGHWPIRSTHTHSKFQLILPERITFSFVSINTNPWLDLGMELFIHSRIQNSDTWRSFEEGIALIVDRNVIWQRSNLYPEALILQRSWDRPNWTANGQCGPLSCTPPDEEPIRTEPNSRAFETQLNMPQGKQKNFIHPHSPQPQGMALANRGGKQLVGR